METSVNQDPRKAKRGNAGSFFLGTGRDSLGESVRSRPSECGPDLGSYIWSAKLDDHATMEMGQILIKNIQVADAIGLSRRAGLYE